MTIQSKINDASRSTVDIDIEEAFLSRNEIQFKGTYGNLDDHPFLETRKYSSVQTHIQYVCYMLRTHTLCAMHA